MDERRLQKLLWVGSAVLIAMLVASFTTVIRAALSAVIVRRPRGRTR